MLFFGFSAQSQTTISNIDSTLRVLKKSKNDTSKVILLQEIAGHYNITDLPKGKKYGFEALELAQELNFDFGEILANNVIANYYQRTNNYKLALKHYNDALAISKRIKSDKGLAIVYNNIGIVHTNQGKYQLAIENYLLALKSEERQHNKIGVAQGYNNIGVVYYYMGNLEKTIEYISKSVKISEKIGRDSDVINGCVNMAAIAELQEDYAGAIKYYEKALRLTRKIADRQEESHILGNIAITYSKQGEYNESNAFHARSIALKDSLGDSSGLAHSYMNFGAALVKQNRFSEAETMILKGVEIAKTLDIKIVLRDGYSSLSDLYEKTNRFELANTYLKKHIAVKDEMFNKESADKISELEVEYQTQKKEKEIAENKVIIQKEKLKTQRKNNMLIALGILVFAILVISIVLIRQQQFKQRKLRDENLLKDQLAEERMKNQLHEERLRISRDLHDNIGSQLTFLTSSMDNLKFTSQEPKVNSKLDELTDFTRSTVTKLRDTIWAMNKENLSVDDFRARLNMHINSVQSLIDSITFNLDTDSDLPQIELSPIKGIYLFRAIQEAINNSVKYSKADQIDISLHVINHTLSISVMDNGIGFDMETVQRGDGLNNMTFRLQEIGGNASIESVVDGGTICRFELPL